MYYIYVHIYIYTHYIYILMYYTYIFMLTEFLPSSKTHSFWWGGVGWGGAITFIGTYTHTWCYATARSSSTATHTWCYATARSSSTATFIKQLSWFDFGPLQEGKTLRGLSIEKLNPQVRRPLFFSQNWCFAMAKRWISNKYVDGENSAG